MSPLRQSLRDYLVVRRALGFKLNRAEKLLEQWNLPPRCQRPPARFGEIREKFQTDPHWRDLVLFHEYFHGDTGAGLGASHQTGWTGLVAKLMQQSGEHCNASDSATAIAAD